MKVLKWLGIAMGALVLLLATVAFGARFADGPVAILPGGPFQSGEWVEDPNVDFGFAADIGEIELESGASPTSRTTWILVEGRKAYIPCSLGFPPGKTWHEEALSRPEAVVRIEGKRYRRKLVKVDDAALEERLTAIVREKYSGGPPSDAGAWFFELAPPS